jgi:hypothetical protein
MMAIVLLAVDSLVADSLVVEAPVVPVADNAVVAVVAGSHSLAVVDIPVSTKTLNYSMIHTSVVVAVVSYYSAVRAVATTKPHPRTIPSLDQEAPEDISPETTLNHSAGIFEVYTYSDLLHVEVWVWHAFVSFRIPTMERMWVLVNTAAADRSTFHSDSDRTSFHLDSDCRNTFHHSPQATSS